MINNFYSNIPDQKVKIIKSCEIKLNDQSIENVIVFPDVIKPISLEIEEENFLGSTLLENKMLPKEIISNLFLGDNHTYTYLYNQFNLIINCAEELNNNQLKFPKIIDLNLKFRKFFRTIEIIRNYINN
jgi:hypothetical protein